MVALVDVYAVSELVGMQFESVPPELVCQKFTVALAEVVTVRVSNLNVPVVPPGELEQTVSLAFIEEGI